ncbi:MAG: hypothetical protein LBM75_02545 [Myxococcales bacterium]|jgi:hypothetical protein|nr:hypothetical protein [Myxococcales bacterium]
MLDAFIIEEIRRKRREEKERTERPSVQLPLPTLPRPPPTRDEEKPSRGVIIIDLCNE